MSDRYYGCMTPDDPCADPNSCDSLACARDRLHLTLRDEADQREGHLPECPSPQIAQAGHAVLSHASCICDRLRACEQRVEASNQGFADMASFELGKREERKRSAVLIADAYAAGVQAARDAVAAACGWRPAGRCSECTHALAAIDALASAPHLDPCDCDDCVAAAREAQAELDFAGLHEEGLA